MRGHAWTIRLVVGMTLISLPGGCAPAASPSPTAAATAVSTAPGAVSDARWKCPLRRGSYSLNSRHLCDCHAPTQDALLTAERVAPRRPCLRTALAAQPDQGQVADVCLEAAISTEDIDHPGKAGGADLPSPAARAAVQVDVFAAVPVVEFLAPAGMAVVAYDPEPLQQVEVSVHRGRRRRGIHVAAELYQLRPTDVLIRRRKRPEKDISLRRPAQAVGTNALTGVRDPIGVGALAATRERGCRVQG